MVQYLIENNLISFKEEKYKNSIREALLAKSTAILDYLFEKGIDINQKGANLLHLAIDNQLDEVIVFLLEKGINPDQSGTFGLTPLHAAVENNNLDLVKLLLKFNADINLTNTPPEEDPESIISGITPLLKALQHQHYEIAEFLIDSGADVNLCDSENQYPLFEAFRSNQVEIMKMLLENGANPNVIFYYGKALNPLEAYLYIHDIENIEKFLNEVGPGKAKINDSEVISRIKHHDKILDILKQYGFKIS